MERKGKNSTPASSSHATSYSSLLYAPLDEFEIVDHLLDDGKDKDQISVAGEEKKEEGLYFEQDVDSCSKQGEGGTDDAIEGNISSAYGNAVNGRDSSPPLKPGTNERYDTNYVDVFNLEEVADNEGKDEGQQTYGVLAGNGEESKGVEEGKSVATGGRTKFTEEDFKWDRGFLDALSEPNREIRLRRVILLHDKFEASARLSATTIIREIWLPVKDKSIKPVSVGGLAGGTKFAHDGVLFKLATDPRLSSGGRYLYGGQAPNLQFAGKACAQELRSASAYFSHFFHDGEVEVTVPMMLMIDWGGFRLVAMPILDMKGAELIYGSDDGGLTVHNDDKRFDEFMKEAGAVLHLAEHRVGDKTLSAGGDVEGHRLTNGRYVLLDLARTWPPESPAEAKHLMDISSAVFFRLLRREFLQLIKADRLFPPLASDALCGWGRGMRRDHHLRVKSATRYMLSALIDTFLQQMASRMVTPPPEKILRGVLLQANPCLRTCSGRAKERMVQTFQTSYFAQPVTGKQVFWAVVEDVRRFWVYYSQHDHTAPPFNEPTLPDDEPWVERLYTYPFCLRIDLSFYAHSVGLPVRHLGLARARLQELLRRNAKEEEKEEEEEEEEKRRKSNSEHASQYATGSERAHGKEKKSQEGVQVASLQQPQPSSPSPSSSSSRLPQLEQSEGLKLLPRILLTEMVSHAVKRLIRCKLREPESTNSGDTAKTATTQQKQRSTTVSKGVLAFLRSLMGPSLAGMCKRDCDMCSKTVHDMDKYVASSFPPWRVRCIPCAQKPPVPGDDDDDDDDPTKVVAADGGIVLQNIRVVHERSRGLV
eukprot:jgi/Bigna1/132391/aug1.17_g7099